MASLSETNDVESMAEEITYTTNVNSTATNEITLITMNLQDVSIASNEGTNGALKNDEALENNGAQENNNGAQKGRVEDINEGNEDITSTTAYNKKGKSKLNPNAEEFIYTPKSTHWEVGESPSAIHQEVGEFSLYPPQELWYTNPTTNLYGYQHPYIQFHPLYPQPYFQNPNLHSEGYNQYHVQDAPIFLGKEHESRAILVNGISPSMSEAEIKLEMEKWGDVRSIKKHPNFPYFATINYYDIRHAKEALTDIQAQHFSKHSQLGYTGNKGESKIDEEQNVASERNLQLERNEIPSILPRNNNRKGLIDGKVVWAIYTQPPFEGPEGTNQGTLVVFNLDAHTDMQCLNALFEGVRRGVKEWRETPGKKQHKFVEYYDVRDAERAMYLLQGNDVKGKNLKIEYSRPGGQIYRTNVQFISTFLELQ